MSASGPPVDEPIASRSTRPLGTGAPERWDSTVPRGAAPITPAPGAEAGVGRLSRVGRQRPLILGTSCARTTSSTSGTLPMLAGLQT